MKLTKVTITGADDSVSPRDLTDISTQHPLTEWGIQLSPAKQGLAGFPSDAWLKMLATLAQTSDPRPHISAHLSGRWLEQLLTGQNKCRYLGLPIFERIQIDFNGKQQQINARAFLAALRKLLKPQQQVIFQMDGVNDYLHTLALASGIDAQALFDHSHGAGITPQRWPKPLPYSTCGYAGGLGPENLLSELRRISAVAGQAETWVDIQSKARSDDGKSLDISKVLACLETAAAFIKHTARAKEPRQPKTKAEGTEGK